MDNLMKEAIGRRVGTKGKPGNTWNPKQEFSGGGRGEISKKETFWKGGGPTSTLEGGDVYLREGA